MIEDRVSAKLWQGYTIESWRRFVAHDWSHPSRPIAWDTVKSCLSGEPLEFCEVGFGGAYDFLNCFKPLHDEGKIKYTGVDYMKQFVDYAKTDYPEYNWMQGEFKTLPPKSWDIIYTRHTAQHQAPDEIKPCLSRFLAATRKYAIIVWHPPLGKAHTHFDQGYCNTFDKKEIDAFIIKAGFSITEIPADEDVVYKMCLK